MSSYHYKKLWTGFRTLHRIKIPQNIKMQTTSQIKLLKINKSGLKMRPGQRNTTPLRPLENKNITSICHPRQLPYDPPMHENMVDHGPGCIILAQVCCSSPDCIMKLLSTLEYANSVSLELSEYHSCSAGTQLQTLHIMGVRLWG